MALSLAIVENLLTEGVVLVDDNCQLIGSQPIGTDDPDLAFVARGDLLAGVLWHL